MKIVPYHQDVKEQRKRSLLSQVQKSNVLKSPCRMGPWLEGPHCLHSSFYTPELM